MARANFLAYNLTTGELLDTFQPPSTPRSAIWRCRRIGKPFTSAGQFTQVNGVNRYRIVAFNLSTGAVRTGLRRHPRTRRSTASRPRQRRCILDRHLHSVNNVARSGAPRAVSAANGAVLPFAVTPAGGNIRQVIVSPGRQQGRARRRVHDRERLQQPRLRHGHGRRHHRRAAPVPGEQSFRNGGENSAILSLMATATALRHRLSRRGGRKPRGRLPADWETGNLVWVEDCHGDTYASRRSATIYVAGHPHYCGSVGGFPQSDPWTFYRGLRLRKAVERITPFRRPRLLRLRRPTPAPKLMHWYPTSTPAPSAGQARARGTLPANDNSSSTAASSPGEQPAQQGLVRFTRFNLAPNTDGPRLGETTPGWPCAPTGCAADQLAGELGPGQRPVELPVLPQRHPDQRVTADSTFFRRPVLSFVDRTVVPGQTYRYKVKASDGFANAMWSGAVAGTPVKDVLCPATRIWCSATARRPTGRWTRRQAAY